MISQHFDRTLWILLVFLALTRLGNACSFGPDPCTATNLFGDEILSQDFESLTEVQRDRERLLRLFDRMGSEGLVQFTKCRLRGPNPVDMSDYEDILLSLGDSSEIPYLLDFNQLQQESYSSQTAIFKAALKHGEEELWRGSLLRRSRAQYLVSVGGFSELHPLVLQTCSEGSESRSNCRTLKYMQSFVSTPGEFSARSSEMASRVLAYDCNEFSDLVKSDPDFRSALQKNLIYFCRSRNSRDSKPCVQLRYGFCECALETNNPIIEGLTNHLLAPPCQDGCPSHLFGQVQSETSSHETPS